MVEGGGGGEPPFIGAALAAEMANKDAPTMRAANAGRFTKDLLAMLSMGLILSVVAGWFAATPAVRR
jgi:hypothetical protein